MHLTGASPDRTIVIASTTATPTGSMVIHPGTAYPHAEAVDRLSLRAKSMYTTDAVAAVSAGLGDAGTANVYLLGVAVQRGAIPVSPAAIERAIDLNGVAVDRNVAAFRLGRRDAATPTVAPATLAEEPTAAMIERLQADLVEYQSERYARRYRTVVDSTVACGSDAFTRAVAFHLHKLMAFKDEYEVARLLLRPESRAAAEAVGGPGAKVVWNLHPPILRAMGMNRKLRLGRWATPVFRLLRAGRRLRGTPLDIFGYASLRRLERKMVGEYIAAVKLLVRRFDNVAEDEAAEIASLPATVRGYEDIKRPRAEAYRAELAARLASAGG
jgi:indolepyruvate ferredoxin oxidoreductase